MSEQKPPSPAAWISQTDNDRCVVYGQRTDGSGKCTFVIVRDRDGVTVYPHGAEQFGVRLGNGDSRTAGLFMAREDAA